MDVDETNYPAIDRRRFRLCTGVLPCDGLHHMKRMPIVTVYVLLVSRKFEKMVASM